MPRFFFHVYNDETCLDDEGQELADVEAARATAIKEARVLIGESVRNGHIVLSHHIAIARQSGELVGDISFGEAVAIRP